MIYNAIRKYILEDADRFTELTDGYRIDLPNEEDVDAFIGLFDNDKAEKLKTLGDVRLFEPSAVMPKYSRDNIPVQLEWNRRIYGADEVKEYLAVAEMEGEVLAADPLLARYGDEWYMITSCGIAFNILGEQRGFITVKGTLQDAWGILQP